MGTAPLSIHVLGELEVVANGRAVALPASRKTRALLGYLVVTGRPVLRERLCDLLWDGPDDPRAALRWSLTKIRPVIDQPGQPRLFADRVHVAFEACGAAIDVELARRLTTTSLGGRPADELGAIVGAMRGDLLEGLNLPDCPRFEAWLRGKRESLRTVRVAALDALVAALEPTSPEEALGHARARVAIDPLAEEAHVAAIRVLGRLGRRADAIEQFESCRRLQESALGRKPSAELLAARASLGTPAPAPPAPVVAPKIEAPPSEPRVDRAPSPIFGRRDERALLERHAAAAAAGTQRELLVFRGEPGMGKSSLLEHAAALARAAGGKVLFGRTYEAEAVRAYGPWIEALRSVSLGELADHAPALGALLPSIASAGEGAPAHREQLFDAVIDLLRRLAEPAPLAVLIDDLQWIDDASAALLHAAVRALAPGRVLFAAAARPGELDDNAAALRLFRGLRRTGELRVVDLAPLEPADAEALARSIDPNADAARVAAESGGNPLYAVHLAREGAHGGAMPRTLREILDERLERLPRVPREIASWAATVGRAFDPELVARASGTSPADLVAAIADLERHGVLRSAAASGSLDFTHDLLRRAALARLSSPRQRFMHLHLARAFAEAQGDGDALAADVAHHAALGGDAELCARQAVIAADRCIRVFARKDADALVTRALAEIARIEGPARISLKIALLRVRVDACIGEAPRFAARVRAELEAAARDAVLAGLRADAAAAHFALGMLRYEAGDHGGAHDDTLAAAEHAQARGAEPRAAARTLANSASCLAELERDAPRARALALEAQALGERHGIDLPDAWIALGLLAVIEGDNEAARPLLDRALELAARVEDRWREFWTLRRLAMLDLDVGRFEDALGRAASMRTFADRVGEGSEVATTHALEALARFALREEGAEDLLAAASEELRLADAKGMLAYVQGRAAEIDLDHGRFASARTRASLSIEAAQPLQRKNILAAAWAARASAALGEGDRSAAGADLTEATAALQAAGETSARARAAVDAARAKIFVPTSAPTEATTPARHRPTNERR